MAKHLNIDAPVTSDLAASHRDKLQFAAKLGWGTKGALYVTLGVLALIAAIGSGGQISGSKGILQWVQQQPLGSVLLIIAGVGFSCYAIWRFVQALIDPEGHSSDKEMIAKRVGWAASGVVHASLAVATFEAVAGSGSGGDTKQMWLSRAMQEGWGAFLVGILGLITIGVGFYQFKRAVDLKFMKDVNSGAMSSRERKAIRFAGRLGLAARGTVFPIIGYYLVKAAMNADASQAKGVGGALHELAGAGGFVLAIVAFGLAAYGVLQLLFARYRRVTVG